MTYLLIKLAVGALATVGLYTVLYRENKFYRFWEHVFLGLAVGYAIVALWTESLKGNWWDKMVGMSAQAGDPGQRGYWLWAMLVPIGLMGYFVFNKKHNWISRIPIGIILGFYSGNQVQNFWGLYGPQISKSLLPVFPTTTASLTVPAITPDMTQIQVAAIKAEVYPTQALSNLIFVFVLLSVLSYFLYSFDVKNKALKFSTTSGRLLLMIGFGAIFGSTVMMRFTLLIDRMYFVFVEFLQQGVWHGLLQRP